MISVTIMGFGNVGRHLYAAFHNASEVDRVQVYNRSKVMHNPEEAVIISKLSELQPTDAYFIALPDDHIADFSEKLPFHNGLVAHTSGSVPLTKLSGHNRRAVFYPLQSFSKDTRVDFNAIPICVEAENESDLKMLSKLGQCISTKVVEINSEDRGKLHLAAVFVNNFVNHLYTISEALLNEHSLDFDLLKPLIEETADKISRVSPYDAQTGPARRNDQKTIEKHMDLLTNDRYRALYTTFTKSIQETYGKEL
ncbi:MAG: Rossmann-like and DUF2520 domain-containing protein [Bacteroidota bacterium]